MNRYLKRVKYEQIKPPEVPKVTKPVDLTVATMNERKAKVLQKMADEQLDVLVIYADREHGANFGYLTGFEPRFEESILVLFADGCAKLVLGNEAVKMVDYSMIKAELVHCPYLSLPNQPMEPDKEFKDFLVTAGLKEHQRIGIVGWKLFTTKTTNNEQIYDVPYFIVEAVKTILNGTGVMKQAVGLFIDPATGVRIINDANEIAYFEFGATLASEKVLNVMNQVEVGKTELELGNELAGFGQTPNITPICATGDRFTNAVVAPRFKEVALGDKFSTTLGFKGGLTSRSAYVVENEEQLPDGVKDYMARVANPYYAAAVAWFENIRIGVTGTEMYELIEELLPKENYDWHLNPGHYVSSDEWMASPIYRGSSIDFKSGNMFQMDIIVPVAGYGSAYAEDGVALADENLRQEIAEKYPEIWARIVARRAYMKDVLGIQIHDEVLPLSSIAGYFRPYLLNKGFALTAK